MAAEKCYQPRNPERSLLYQVVAGQLETFLARRRELDRELPGFVEQEFRAFLDCGVLARGFLRVHCDACGKDRLVPFSCKKRGFCSSCGGRRMADTAAHLVDNVFPVVPVRQWVLSLPFALRYRLAFDAPLMGDVVGAFARCVFGSLRARARDRLGLARTRCGAVTFIQRFGSALNLTPHFHMLAIDGIYAAGAGAGGEPEFHELPAPDDDEVADVVADSARRIQMLIKRRGLSDSDFEEADPLFRDNPGLAAIAAASVQGRIAAGPNAGKRLATLGDQIDPEALGSHSGPRCATLAGFSLHADVAVPAKDRARLERLCRYAARPALATDRLSRLPDGRLSYRLKRPWRNGATEVVFEPEDLVARLAALVPAPRAHLVRYQGVFGPAAAWRAGVVPEVRTQTARSSVVRADAEPAEYADAPLEIESQKRISPARNYSWSQLMRRVFLVDVLQCDRCGGSMRILTVIMAPEAARKILDCLRLPSRPPPLAPARPERSSNS